MKTPVSPSPLQKHSCTDLVSIIVVCCNEETTTRHCLESVVRNTSLPYELILVDNGSSASTRTFLRSFQEWEGPQRVDVVVNPANRGFAAGCNQGLDRAQGRNLVILHNDVIVTPRWLDGLLGCARLAGPEVGLVGPVTSSARPPQQIRWNYTNQQELDAFAVQRQQNHAGLGQNVKRLSSCCLLLRREVLEKIGPFDERLGPGFFVEEDLCLRARDSGYRLLLALEVYVHHDGGRTAASLGLESPRQLARDWEVFRDKWGPERAANYQVSTAPPSLLTSTVPPSSATREEPALGSRPRVSLCMIVKDEAVNLGRCLASVADLLQEMIVVDTGSSDQTREVARSLGSRVVDFPWVDDFAAARNESLRHATGAWIFWLDADEFVDEENRRRLRTLFRSLDNDPVGYLMKQWSAPDEVTGSIILVDQVRLFPNHPALRWEYRVHEQILPALARQGGSAHSSDVVIQHSGYQDSGLRQRKLERNLRLLHLAQQEFPDDPFTLFNLGAGYLDLGRAEDALALLNRCLERTPARATLIPKLFALMVTAHRRLGQLDQALLVCRQGRERCPDDGELLFLEGVLLVDRGELTAAETCLTSLLHSQPGRCYTCEDAGLRGYKTRHHLAQVYRQQGRIGEALEQWKEVVRELPTFDPAWLGIGDIYLEQGRDQEVQQTLDQLESRPPGPETAVILRAHWHAARGEFSQARHLLEAAHYQASPGIVAALGPQPGTGPGRARPGSHPESPS